MKLLSMDHKFGNKDSRADSPDMSMDMRKGRQPGFMIISQLREALFSSASSFFYEEDGCT